MKQKLLSAIQGIGIILITVLLGYACTSKSSSEKAKTTKSVATDSVSFSYTDISGIGFDSLCNRRDNSDVIRVGNKYYVYYSKMDSSELSGYRATIWVASSDDEGYTWKEQGMALGLGEKGAFDSYSVFTPNILEYGDKYYLYYTAVKPTPGNVNNEFERNATTDITAIGLAVADSPDGPFIRVENNPVLQISEVSEDFDSYRIDDASLLVRDNKIWLYYKGRSIKYGKEGPKYTQMGVALADHPEGPYQKHPAPILDKSHEVLVWESGEGIASLASFSFSINYAPDGINFSPLHKNLVDIPKAPGLYRPGLSDGKRNTQAPGWGIAMTHKNKRVYLLRFEMKKE